MHATMNVGVVLLVVSARWIDHRLRFLRCRRIVQINQRLAVNLPPEYGKVTAELLHVEIVSGARTSLQGLSGNLLGTVVMRFPPISFPCPGGHARSTQQVQSGPSGTDNG